MCVIIVKPANVPLPSKEILKRAAWLNSHGFGFALPGVKPFKTMSFEVFYQRLLNVDDMQPMILHFRYATHGSKCPSNCHPFYDAKTGVSFAHNGILDVRPGLDMTDSETAFRALLQPAIELHGGSIKTVHLKRAVDCIIGGSRFAFMDRHGYIKTFGRFYQYGRCFYSNANIFGNFFAGVKVNNYICR